jgi:hypothetical protein
VLPRHRGLRVERAAGGSAWSVVVRADDGARWLVKLRGAAHGTSPLVAEVLVAELADALGLPVPARAVIALDDELTSADPHQELVATLARSRGDNLGLAYLPDAHVATAADVAALEPSLAAQILWLDGLVGNVDRTVANPNLLVAGGRPWLIDHGAALPFHYAWAAVTEDTPRRAPAPRAPHLLARFAPGLPTVDEACAAALTRDVLIAAAAAVPESFLAPLTADPARARAAYVAFLWKRLRSPRPFVSPAPL